MAAILDLCHLHNVSEDKQMLVFHRIVSLKPRCVNLYTSGTKRTYCTSAVEQRVETVRWLSYRVEFLSKHTLWISSQIQVYFLSVRSAPQERF